MGIDIFIPSKTYKFFLHDKNIELTPWQKAKLICRSHRSFEERWAGYRELIASDKTDDELRKALERIVSYEEAFVGTELKELSEAVYSLEVCVSEADYQCEEAGIYNSLDTAVKIGRRMGYDFIVKRHSVKPLTEDEIDCIASQFKKQGYCDDTIMQTFHYNSEGKLKKLDRMHGPAGCDSSDYDVYSAADEFVEGIYADLPLCFQNGDIVRTVGDKGFFGHCGIFHIFPNRDEQIKSLLAANCTPDDEELVEFMDEAGAFSHEHLLVTELELADIEDIPKEQRTVLDCAAALVKGSGTIDAFEFSILEMKRKRGQLK